MIKLTLDVFVKPRMIKVLIIFFVFSTTLGCTKYEVQSKTDNNPPADNTITEERKVSYINRLYITLIGAKPNHQQLEDALNTLSTDPHDVVVRKSLVADVIASSGYYSKLWEDARGDLLDGVDTVTIQNEYNQAVVNYNNTTGNSKQYWYDQMMRLQPLIHISQELASGALDMPTMHRRAINNPIYDDINMGTENFVVSVFQNFFFRYPTNAELAQSKKMVDGQQAVLFLQSGDTKSDFMDIIFSSSDYVEGQVIYVYQKYLFRNPSSQELSTLTQVYQDQGDYKALQSEILASDEYLFF